MHSFSAMSTGHAHEQFGGDVQGYHQVQVFQYMKDQKYRAYLLRQVVFCFTFKFVNFTDFVDFLQILQTSHFCRFHGFCSFHSFCRFQRFCSFHEFCGFCRFHGFLWFLWFSRSKSVDSVKSMDFTVLCDFSGQNLQILDQIFRF